MLPDQTPLIVVDMQNGFLNRKSEHVIVPVRTLVEHWVESKRPIYFTKFINAPGSQWQDWLDWHRLQSSPETDIAEALSHLVPKGLTMEKHSYTSITGRIGQDMRTHRWEAAVVCGVATDGCVMETAVDLFQSRVRPLVVVDACASHAGDEVHRMGLHLLRRSIGARQLVTVESTVAALRQQ